MSFLSQPKEWIFDQNKVNIIENLRSNTALRKYSKIDAIHLLKQVLS